MLTNAEVKPSQWNLSLSHWRGEATPLVSLKGFISTTLITIIVNAK